MCLPQYVSIRELHGQNLMIITSIVRWPKIWAFLTAVASLLAGAFAAILAELGGPAWVFVLLGVWLWTIGLPTTLAVLLLVSLWGEAAASITGSLELFVVLAVILSLCFQGVSVLWMVRVLRRKREV